MADDLARYTPQVGRFSESGLVSVGQNARHSRTLRGRASRGTRSRFNGVPATLKRSFQQQSKSPYTPIKDQAHLD